ncbi:Yip1 family protein [Niallia sp. XMNu-256]|uniref:Yip1 family protein n=1 Tax=Niallia sp. XMNu-256 TaxID=3082444 RepID=UPI0030CF5C45
MSEEVQAKKPSIWGILWSPTEQFERIKERPRIWGALAIVTILFVIGMYLSSFGKIPEINGVSEEDLAGMQAFNSVLMIVMGIITPIFGILISTVIYFLIAKIARSEVSFKQLFSMNTYIMILSALSILINGIGIALLGGTSDTIYTSLGSIIQAEGALGGFLTGLEVFTIWGVILNAIGLHKVAEFSKGLAWTISIAFFVIGLIFSMIAAGVSGMVGV